jgi:hypothetical protein
MALVRVIRHRLRHLTTMRVLQMMMMVTMMMPTMMPAKGSPRKWRPGRHGHDVSATRIEMTTMKE